MQATIRELVADDLTFPLRDLDAEPFGLTLEIDGDIAVVGGVFWKAGRCWAFCSIYDDRARHSLILHRRAKRLLGILRETGETEICTLCDEWVPRAERWLKKLGFEPTGEYLGAREVWVWT